MNVKKRSKPSEKTSKVPEKYSSFEEMIKKPSKVVFSKDKFMKLPWNIIPRYFRHFYTHEKPIQVNIYNFDPHNSFTINTNCTNKYLKLNQLFVSTGQKNYESYDGNNKKILKTNTLLFDQTKIEKEIQKRTHTNNKIIKKQKQNVDFFCTTTCQKFGTNR